VPDTHGHTLGMLCWFGTQVIPTLVQKKCPFVHCQNVMCWFEVLGAGVEGPCLHRPGNWFVRQLNHEPKLVYKVGFIREKGKATARQVQRSPETGNSLLR
jgi:hypothetical protein